MLKAIELAWFRGAAKRVALPLDGDSVVVYGPNGSGKSSFVDAIEHFIREGKIGHLSHEYSGKGHVKAVPNTHCPKGKNPEYSILFVSGGKCEAQMGNKGVWTFSGRSSASSWDYRRTVLRQEEVSEFIRETKGGKYSAVLPLLGLSSLETCADNLRQLARTIEVEGKILVEESFQESIERERSENFGSLDDAGIKNKLHEIWNEHSDPTTRVAKPTFKDLIGALDESLKTLGSAQRLVVYLRDIAGCGLESAATAARNAFAKLAQSLEPLVAERLAVLQSAATFSAGVKAEEKVRCPACGSLVSGAELQVHILQEQARLHAAQALYRDRRTAVTTFIDAISVLRDRLNKPEVRDWLGKPESAGWQNALGLLSRLDAESLRESWAEDVVKPVLDAVLPFLAACKVVSDKGAPEATRLADDRQKVGVAKRVFDAQRRAESLSNARSLRDFVRACEEGVRKELKSQADGIISRISADVQAMWSVLHPNSKIDNIELYFPDDADKAVDIRLRFHGTYLDSPRLTLSEGYRNSLGLCIFLTMVKQDGKRDRPLVLDDVVVSMDRSHRGKVSQLLETHFPDHQILLFTHDRDWFTELRHLLKGNRWKFQALRPYQGPTEGITIVANSKMLAIARDQLKARPEVAANDARRAMDVNLPIILEKLEVELPFKVGERNDKRTTGELMPKLRSSAKGCFKSKTGSTFAVHATAEGILKQAESELISWGNRGSHSSDVVESEAEQLISSCEAALEVFTCAVCKRPVWYAKQGSSGRFQCECGALRWD